MRALVAGCGYVGSKLATDLVEAGHEVSVLSRHPPSIPGARAHAADLGDPATLDALPDVDVAIFTAAPDARNEAGYRSIYVDGLRALKNALPATSRLVFTSSTAVYGQRDGELVDESSETAPGSYRGRILLEAEAIADVSVRLGGIYGPGRAGPLDRLRSGTARCTPGRYLNLVHRDDAARALAHVAQLASSQRQPKPPAVSAYVGVDHEPVLCETVFGWLSERTGLPTPPADESISGRGKRCASRLLRSSGFTFRFPSFREGFESLLAPPRLAPCPGERGDVFRPNCVSTQATDERQRMDPLFFSVSLEEASDEIAGALTAVGGDVVARGLDFVRAEFSSLVFRFVDDAEVRIHAASRRVDFRSASRLGYYDFGVNRRRMERFASRLRDTGDFFSVSASEEAGS